MKQFLELSFYILTYDKLRSHYQLEYFANYVTVV